MKTFATAVLAGCLMIVIALQVLLLRNQNHQESTVRIQSIDRNYPHIELASYAIPEVQGEADNFEDSGSEDIAPAPEFVEAPSAPMFPADSMVELKFVTPDLPPTLVPAEIEPELSLLDAEPQAELAFDSGDSTNSPPQPLSANVLIPSATVITGPAKVPTPVTATGEVAGAPVEAEPPATEKYPMWLLLKPDGVQFLQSDEELATNLSSIPANAFLVGCFEPKFEGLVANDKPDFQLTCQKFMLKGRYGTPQMVLIEGAELRYSTLTRKIELQGSEEIELTCEIENGQLKSHLRADEITFQLHDDSFQVSVKGSTSLEIDAYPAPVAKPRASDSRGFDPFPESGSVNNLPTY